MRRCWRHLRGLWPGSSILVPAPFVAHSAWAAARGVFRWENAAVLLLVAALFVTGPRTKRLLLGIYPLGLVGLLYETMHVVEDVGVSPATVHLCDLRAWDAALFGLTVNGERVTLHDWFLAHPSPVLDAVCAVPYGTFIFVCIACAAWLHVRDPARMVRFGWCFFALNVAGFVTYHLYPAAAPWYFHTHGCLVSLPAHASEGAALARVDARLGVAYFAGMYGRASDVFGAMPSLHCAYALIVAVVGWPTFSNAWRAASVAFVVLMCFAAVYLDHHWVLDVVAGLGCCAVVLGVARGWRKVAWAVATWFGCGFVPRAPGTAGTLGAVPLYLLAATHGRTGVALAALAVAAVGVWSASVVARETASKDPQIVVVDEVAGMLLTMTPVAHPSWQAVAAGFLVFRLLDVTKPWPVRRLEALPGGWGIVLDDVGAGLAGACAMAALQAAGVV